MVNMLQRVPVLESKLHPPSLPPGVIYRKCYPGLIKSICSLRLTRVTAPAGYGKSVFLSVFAEREDYRAAGSAGGKGPPAVAWYTLDDIDRDAAVFLTHLVRSLDMALGGFGIDTRRTLFSVADIEKTAGIVAAALAEEMWQGASGRLRDVVIVLDDYHSVAGARAVDQVVHFLTNNLPPDVHLCLAGRHRTDLNVERLALRGQVGDIGAQELSFDREEIIELLDKINGSSCDPELCGEIEAATGGWPAGVVLAAQSARQGGEGRISGPVKGIGREAAFRFFAEEIFNLQNDEIRRFLVGSSFLRHLTPEACRVVLGFPNAAALLEEAANKGLFLNLVEVEGQKVYRFHQLFRSFLARNRDRYFPGPAAAALHKEAAAHYENNGSLDAAMAHYLDGGLTGDAAGLLYRRGVDLIELGRVDQLRLWLNALPAGVIESNPRFLYYTGFVYQNSDPARAVNSLDRAAAGLAGRGELGLEVRALIYMATIYSLQNRVDKVKEAASRIPALEAIRKDPWSRGVLTVAALCQSAWDDNLGRGVWLGRLARRLPLDPDWYWAHLSYSCMIYYRLGDLDMSRRLVEEALSLPVVKNNDHWRGLALVLHHVVLYSQDDEQTGEKVREELWSLGEKYNSAYFKAYAERARAFSRYHRDVLDQAGELFKSSLYFFESAGNSAMACITRLNMALLDSRRGHAREALEDARQALDTLRALNCGQGLEEMGQSLFGALALEAGDLDLAEHHLVRSARASRRKGAKQILAGTCLHLAQLYTLRGRPREAADHLSKALAIASRHGYLVFWDWHRPTVLAQCLRALELGIHPAYTGRLLARWFGPEALVPVAALAEKARGDQRKRLQGILAALKGEAAEEAAPSGGPAPGAGDAAGNGQPAIRIRLLGSLEVIIDGTPVPEKSWQTQKVKTLFKYLVLNRGRKASREQMMEMLWPEADPASSAASLRVALTRMRRALSPDGARSRGKTPFFGDERGLIWFDPGEDYALDTEEFEREVRAGMERMEAGDGAGARECFESALELYRGDLLEEDLYEDWAASDRERLQITCLNVLITLSRIHLDTGHLAAWNLAIGLLQRALAINPYREETYLALMEAYRLAGQRGEALRVYKKCRKMLEEEFGVAPGRAMITLAGEISGKQVK